MNGLRAACLISACLCWSATWAAEPEEATSPSAELIPHHLLGLVHAPEVHRELGLTSEQVQGLEALFSEIDGPWFRLRILAEEQQRPVIEGLEQRVHQWFEQNTSADQQQRLQQLEYQSQGTRSLLRDDIAQRLELASSQRRRLIEAAQATTAAQHRLQAAQRQGEDVSQLRATADALAKAERAQLKKVIQPAQLRTLGLIIGKPLDTSRLQRIHPMAPEFEPVEHWLNSAPLSLRQLRGKVVLVHFYAFQCHNCQANFDHYRRWHEQFGDEEVVIIGIQTPETSAERDLAAVTAAASERDLRFPILVDLESKNWNAWANTMWPTIYVIDKKGYLRHWWQGELNWQGATGDKTIEDLVARLRQEE